MGGTALQEVIACKHLITAPYITVWQGCTNSGHHVAMATKFPAVAINPCACSVGNLVHAAHLAPRILKWLQFLEN